MYRCSKHQGHPDKHKTIITSPPPPPPSSAYALYRVWVFHEKNPIGAAETGLEILYELLMNVGRTPEVAQGFYRQFLLSLIQVSLSLLLFSHQSFLASLSLKCE